MANKTSICKQALGKLGANTIIDATQMTTEAQLCEEYYQDILEDILEEHPWTFAIKRYELPKSAESPPKPFAAKFLVPPDVLRVLDASSNPDFTEMNPTDWQLEGRYIIANAGIMYARAVSKQTDPGEFSAKFTRVLVTRLAAEMALAITQSRELHKQLMDEFAILLDYAVSADGQQGRSRKYRSDQLILVRTSGTSFAGPFV